MSLIEEAARLYADAREQKRLSAVYRRRARLRMDELRRFCVANDIAVEIVKAEAQRHGPVTERERSARAS